MKDIVISLLNPENISMICTEMNIVRSSIVNMVLMSRNNDIVKLKATTTN